MSSYKEHQNLIKRFKLLLPKEIPIARLMERHVGLFYTKRGTPVQINKKGMSDGYLLVKTKYGIIEIELEFKTGNAVLSKYQKTWKKFIEEIMGGKFIVIRDEYDGIKEIKEYLDGLFTD